MYSRDTRIRQMLKTWRPSSQTRHCHHLYSMLPFYDGDPDTPPYMRNSCDDGPGHPVILSLSVCVCVCVCVYFFTWDDELKVVLY